MSDDPLRDLLRAAGGAIGMRHGRAVATHFGSAPGELSVCVRAVGLVDRSHLSVLAVRGAAQALPRLLDLDLAEGGCAREGDTWWANPGGGELLLVGTPRAVARTHERLAVEARRHSGFTVLDRTAELARIGVVGKATPAVLGELGVGGVDGDARGARPVCSSRVAQRPVTWLLQSDRCVLTLTAREHAADVWRAIAAAGRPLGMGHVGHDAAEQYLLWERGRQLRPVPHPVSG